jgi:hypothetical protein
MQYGMIVKYNNNNNNNNKHFFSYVTTFLRCEITIRNQNSCQYVIIDLFPSISNRDKPKVKKSLPVTIYWLEELASYFLLIDQSLDYESLPKVSNFKPLFNSGLQSRIFYT